jgi:hypothetical protein
LFSRTLIKQESPWGLEYQITVNSSNTLELWGYCAGDAGIEWGTMRDIFRVGSKNLIDFTKGSTG